jgi:aminoglycoside phosphotransferase family enzyme
MPRVAARGAGSPEVSTRSKLKYLLLPQAYPDRPRRVGLIETHMSWVFLSRRYAYKMKKPVRYPFLDFSTVEARRRDSEEELRLNRRLAEGVYLDLVPLTVDSGGGLRLGGPGRAVDWLVRMRRLARECMLDQAIRRHRLRRPAVHRTALVLARFYARATPVRMALSDYLERYRRDIRLNLDMLRDERFALPAGVVERVCGAQLRFLKGHPGLFAERVRGRRIVEAHGDLRPEHICLEPRPVIIDCLQFNRGFRIMDSADELAHLAMECERLGAPWVGEHIFRIYRRITADRPDAALLRFYKSYRACLRGRLAACHLRDRSIADTATWRSRAREYLQLAAGYLASAER